MTVLARMTFTTLLIATLSCKPATAPTDEPTPEPPTPAASPGGVTQLQIVDLRAGTGVEAATGRYLTVRYAGWLYEDSKPEKKGAQFDANTYAFFLGYGQVIAGWDQGLRGMRVGGMRRLLIPPSLAYGASGRGPIPPNASLVFDCELLDAR